MNRKQHKAKINLMFPGKIKTPMIVEPITFTKKEIEKGKDYMLSKALKKLKEILYVEIIFEEDVLI